MVKIKKSSLRRFFKLLLFFIIFIQIDNLLETPIHELGHIVSCEYIKNDCKITNVKIEYNLIQLKGYGEVHSNSKLPLEEIPRFKDRFNESNITFYKNKSLDFRFDKNIFKIDFKYRDRYNPTNETINPKMTVSRKLYDQNDNLTFKEKLIVYRFKLGTLMGPIFQIIFLVLSFIFLKKIKYPLNIIGPYFIYHDLIHTAGISTEVLYFFNLLNYPYSKIIYYSFSWLIIIYSFYILNKKKILFFLK